jgi:hypothetical protein
MTHALEFQLHGGALLVGLAVSFGLWVSVMLASFMFGRG